MSELSAFEFGPEIDKLSAALVAFQGKVGPVSKTKTARVRMKAGGEYTYDYADLTDVIASTKEARTAAGLAVIQMPVGGDGEIIIVTTIVHSSGQWMRSSLKMRTTDSSPQAIGSLITYGRRYSYSAALGICTEADDDGNAAQGNSASTKGRAEGKAPAPRIASATPAAGKTEPTTMTAPTTDRPKAARANTVKSDGTKSSPEQVKLLHVLRGKVGGLVVCEPKAQCPYPNGKRCGYHTQLAAFKLPDGSPVLSSKDLSPEQISNLIARYEAKIVEQGARAAEAPDLGAALERPVEREPGSDDVVSEEMADAGDLADLEEAAFKRWGSGFNAKFGVWLRGAFDYSTVMELRKQEAIDATAMIKAGK